MSGKRDERLFRNGVDRVRRRKLLDVHGVRRGGIFRAGAAPQQALRSRSCLSEFLPSPGIQQFAITFVSPSGDRDAKTVAKRGGNFVRDGFVPSADEDGRYRSH